MAKQHGSLARAGKVKNQTPKVSTADKAKTSQGRAKKRSTYNRRIVAVNAQPGEKVKMNPQVAKQ